MKRLTAVLIVLGMLAFAGTAPAEDAPAYDGNLRIENGTLLPMCENSEPRYPGYSNENSDILRFCV